MIPFGFLKQPASGATPLYDGVSVMYTLRTPDMTTLWTNAVLKVRRTSDNVTAFLFVDGSVKDDTITTSGLISTTSNTTPDATTFGTWLGANNCKIEEWIGITDDNTIDNNKTVVQTTTTVQPRIATGGVIRLKNGKPEVWCETTTKTLSASTANTDLNSGNDFTIFTVTYSDSSSAQQAFFSSRIATGGVNQRFSIFNDRRSNKIMCRIRSATSINYEPLYIAQQNTANQRLLTTVVDGTAKDVEGFLGGVSQDSKTWTSTYDNTGIRIGAEMSITNPINGGVQEIVAFPNNSTDQATIETDIDTYYSIP